MLSQGPAMPPLLMTQPPDEARKVSSSSYLGALSTGNPLSKRLSQRQALRPNCSLYPTPLRRSCGGRGSCKQLNLTQNTILLCCATIGKTLRLFTNKGPSFYTKLRHIDTANHWLHQEISKGTIKLAWARTNDMSADGLTKALPKQKHKAFIKLIGLVDIEERIQHHNT